MKKLIIKCVVMVTIFLGISQYFVYLTTGKKPLEGWFDGWETPDISTINMDAINMGALKDVIADDTAPTGNQTIYKWVDDNGVTQYSESPPPEEASTATETLNVNPDTNIVQGLAPKEENPENNPPQVALPKGPIYSPETIQKVMGDAQNVQNLLNERYEAQNKALEGL